VDQSETDTWHSAIGWKGATWPNHGLPRGTPGLANEGYVKSFWGPGDSNPGPPPPHALTNSATTRPHCACYVCELIVFKFVICILAGGRAGA
jgi:hypothetical protein